MKLVSNKPKQNLVLSSRCKKKSPNIQPNISLENYFQHNDNSKDTKKSLNNLFRTYNYTKIEPDSEMLKKEAETQKEVQAGESKVHDGGRGTVGTVSARRSREGDANATYTSF